MSNVYENYKDIMAGLIQTVDKTAMITSNLSQQMGLLNSTVAEHELKINTLTDRMNSFEDNERINRTQARLLRETIHRRCAKLLNITYDENGRPTDDCIQKSKLYFKPFVSACYRKVKSMGLMAEVYYETPKKNYDPCIELIDAWIPDGGVLSYIEYLDKRRAA